MNDQLNERLRVIQYAMKATHGDLCANHGCFRRITEGTLCLECDKRRQERDEDILTEGENDADNEI